MTAPDRATCLSGERLRAIRESDNFTQLLEEQMNWADSNNEIIQMLLQSGLPLSYFHSNFRSASAAGGE